MTRFELRVMRIAQGLCSLIVGVGVYAAAPLGALTTSAPDRSLEEPLTSRRPVTVADGVEMVRVAGDPHYQLRPPFPPLAYFSPDGGSFLIVLRKGNLKQNTNDYSMMLFRTEEAFHSPSPDELLSMSSSSNRDAIRNVKWINNDMLAFIGEHPGENPQVYEFSIKDRTVRRFTNHGTPVTEFWVNGDGTQLIFRAESGKKPELAWEGPDKPVVVTDQKLVDILAGYLQPKQEEYDVFSQDQGRNEVKLTEKDWPGTEKSSGIEPKVKVLSEEGLNSPQKLYVEDERTKQKALLWDLNPQFEQLEFAKAEPICWKAKDSRVERGGLYLPVDYRAGERYPLVIQTHFFSKDTFIIDGPWSSAFAAQALAGRGIVVVQVAEFANHEEGRSLALTAKEAPHVMGVYEGLIDALDARGLIDRNRVGILGFSRTVYYVAYSLTHSNYPFAAATIEDGIDGGYFEYIYSSEIAQEDNSIYGGPPFGNQLEQSWIRNAPGFNLDKVKAPVRIMTHGVAGAMSQWEWFAGLTALRKPVDLVILPNSRFGEHLLKKPWEQRASEEGTLDWFCFWLKNEEDPDPGKASQYQRWRALKSQY